MTFFELEIISAPPFDVLHRPKEGFFVLFGIKYAFFSLEKKTRRASPTC
jgi:hypothetical protein